jgi:hypothetical protein
MALFSAVSPALTLPSARSGFPRCGRWRSSRFAKRYSERISPALRFMGTYTELADKTLSELTSSAAALLASPSAKLGRKKARETLASSGRRCFELWANSNRAGSSLRTFVDSCLTTEDGLSKKYAPVWRLRVTKSFRSYFQLAVSVPRIGETESGFWPTPKVSRFERGTRRKTDGKAGITLPEKARLCPTPTNNMAGKLTTRADKLDQAILATNGGKLNPEWVEWLMGYPCETTALNVSETQSYRKSLRGSGRKSSGTSKRAASFDRKEAGVATEELAIVDKTEAMPSSSQTGQNPVSSATAYRRNSSEKSGARKQKNKRKKYLKSLEADARAFVKGFKEAEATAAEAKVLHRKFKDVVTEMRPIFERIRYGFAHLRKGETVMGERTGSAWAPRCIGVTYDWLCRCLSRSTPGTLLFTDGTKVLDPPPAKPDASGTEQEIPLPKLNQSLPTTPPTDTADWTDNQYIKMCVDFIETTLRPLECDPQRFHRVAVAIAHEILGELGSEDIAADSEPELAAVNE